MDEEKHKIDWNPATFVCEVETTARRYYPVPDPAICIDCGESLPSEIADEFGWWLEQGEWECPECKTIRDLAKLSKKH